MWVLCCGMHRSGSTLQYQIATKVAQFHPNADIVGWVSPAETADVLGNATDSAGELHIAKLHNYDPAVDAFWKRVQPKAIYIYRDLRDVVVSTMKMENWAFYSLELLTRFDDILQNDRSWTQKSGIMISRYEDVMAEGGLAAEVKRIAEYMEISLTEAEIAEIAQAVSLKENKRSIEQFDYENKGVQYPNTLFNPQSLFHNNHIRSGASEQWREELSAEEIAAVEIYSGSWLQERGYQLASPHSEQEKFDTLHKMIEFVLEQANRNLREIAGLNAYAKSLNVQLEIARNRKIVRVMSKLGRPLI